MISGRSLASDWSVEGNGDPDAGASDDDQREQVDDEEEEEEESASEVTVRSGEQEIELVESVVADLSRDESEMAADGERVTLAVEVWSGEEDGQDPGGQDHLPRPTLAVDHDGVQRVHDGAIPGRVKHETRYTDIPIKIM